MTNSSDIEYKMADLEDRLRRLDPVCDVNWRQTCQEAAALLREIRTAIKRAEKEAALA